MPELQIDIENNRAPFCRRYPRRPHLLEPGRRSAVGGAALVLVHQRQGDAERRRGADGDLRVAAAQRPARVLASRCRSRGHTAVPARLVSIVWALELIVEPRARTERVEITMAPGGTEVVLGSIAPVSERTIAGAAIASAERAPERAMRARDNPFTTDRVLRISATSWRTAIGRPARAARWSWYRAAIVGPHGSGRRRCSRISRRLHAARGADVCPAARFPSIAASTAARSTPASAAPRRPT